MARGMPEKGGGDLSSCSDLLLYQRRVKKGGGKGGGKGERPTNGVLDLETTEAKKGEGGEFIEGYNIRNSAKRKKGGKGNGYSEEVVRTNLASGTFRKEKRGGKRARSPIPPPLLSRKERERKGYKPSPLRSL